METRVAAPLQCSEPTDLHTSHFLICIFLPSLPRISLFSLSYSSPPSLVFPFSLFHISPLSPLYFPFLSFIFFPSLPCISPFSLSHFYIPGQMDHTCNFLDFYLRFQMVSWQRQIGYRIHIPLTPMILRLKSKI